MPLLSGEDMAQFQVPLLFTVVVQIVSAVMALVTVIVPPGWPVPVNTGVVSLVDVPLIGLDMAGADSVLVSIATWSGALWDEVFPAVSLIVAVMVCAPSLSGVDRV